MKIPQSLPKLRTKSFGLNNTTEKLYHLSTNITVINFQNKSNLIFLSSKQFKKSFFISLMLCEKSLLVFKESRKKLEKKKRLFKKNIFILQNKISKTIIFILWAEIKNKIDRVRNKESLWSELASHPLISVNPSFSFCGALIKVLKNNACC